MTTTAAMWALPGQIAMVELYAAGSSFFAIVLAVGMANARFLPMTATLMPLMRPGVRHVSWLYVMSQFVSFNSWIWAVRRFPEIPMAYRPTYYSGFVTSTFVAGLVGTALGYILAGVLPEVVALGLVFGNVIYFSLLFANTDQKSAIFAIFAGAVAGPLLHLVSGEWGLLMTGLVGGTLAFVVKRRWFAHG